jgi:hypothetical protein
MNDQEPQPKPSPTKIQWYVVDPTQMPPMDEAAVQRLLQYLEGLFGEEDVFDFDLPSVFDEMAALELIDAEVKGDDHPQALEMIMNSYRKHQL